MRPTPIVLLLVLALLAGCSDDKASDTDSEPITDDLKSTATTGVIRGVILDETITPVEGVSVSIKGHRNATTTGPDGRFGFDGLEPGTYVLDASKPGHDQVQTTAKVLAGVSAPAILKITLPRLPETVPYILPIQVRGILNCEVLAGALLQSCDLDTGVAGEDTAQFFLPVDERVPHAVQVELDWESNQQAGDSLTMTFGSCTGGDYCSPYGIGTNMLCQTWGQSLLWCSVNQYSVVRSGKGAGGSTVGQTNLGVGSGPGIALAVGADCSLCTPAATPQCSDACGVGVVLQQEFDAYVHVFYNFTPEEGWLFVEDGPHPVPER